MAVIGTGVIIIITFWAISIVSIFLFWETQGKLKSIAVVLCIITAIITIILPSIPTSFTSPYSNIPAYNFSYLPLIWIFILTGLVLTLIICLLTYFLTDVLEARYAPSLKLVKK